MMGAALAHTLEIAAFSETDFNGLLPDDAISTSDGLVRNS
jgi:hypothetical protein